MNQGKVVQVIGPVVDVQFTTGNLPEIYTAIKINSKNQPQDTKTDKEIDITMEAMQHLGNNTVRCVSFSSTDGLQRGMMADDTKEPIKVPVGKGVLGRMFNVLGNPIDGGGKISAEEYLPIHRSAPRSRPRTGKRNFGNRYQGC